jgi:hypothetical protein
LLLHGANEAPDLSQAPGSAVRVGLETNVLVSVVVATGKECQRPFEASAGSGCLLEAKASSSTFCLNRLFAIALGVPTTYKQLTEL